MLHNGRVLANGPSRSVIGEAGARSIGEAFTSLTGDGTVADGDHDAVKRALLDCPVHAITEPGDRGPDVHPPSPLTDEDPAAHLKTEANEAEWGFTR